ncbi:rRNA 2'-O-methyltransferase fibrillarin [Oncorhynchus tshawytscha]|uniref:rRNA 2'-O-methyltransferase fibrillarin n=1 Tax=Oncorhynchus tshawytscha TaxID=74940 RepID=UPI000D09A587|nr:rRNA 2'-O-methyltransferase fibrillarin [Oncorhynchus tshawytscha]XP_042155701.1 rRNA 2'-O-methyltransferase fibrillarin [Oncorhynchus tshawytscha]
MIRYLKQKLPEEWTVDHLAEGFSLHRDIFLRVLRSKFTPTPERKAKQDSSVWARLRQQEQAIPGGGTGEAAAGPTWGWRSDRVGNGPYLGMEAGQGSPRALPGDGGTEGQGRQQVLPGGGGTGGLGRQQVLPGGGGTG